MSALGRKLHAARKKTGEPYEVVVNGQHMQVMSYLLQHAPASDWEIVHAHDGGSHQLGARRCELRDAGMVEQVGTSPSGMTWRLTSTGRDLLLHGTVVGAA